MKYLVKDSQDNLVMIGATGFTPQGVVAQVPKELESEDAKWLKVIPIYIKEPIAVLDELGEPVMEDYEAVLCDEEGNEICTETRQRVVYEKDENGDLILQDSDQVERMEAQVDEDLKAQILAERAQKEAEAKAQETARMLAREARTNRVNSNPLRTLEDLRQAVQDILDHLGMK